MFISPIFRIICLKILTTRIYYLNRYFLDEHKVFEHFSGKKSGILVILNNLTSKYTEKLAYDKHWSEYALQKKKKTRLKIWTECEQTSENHKAYIIKYELIYFNRKILSRDPVGMIRNQDKVL